MCTLIKKFFSLFFFVPQRDLITERAELGSYQVSKCRGKMSPSVFHWERLEKESRNLCWLCVDVFISALLLVLANYTNQRLQKVKSRHNNKS